MNETDLNSSSSKPILTSNFHECTQDNLLDGWMDGCVGIIVDIDGWISSRKTKCRVKAPGGGPRFLFQFCRKVVHFF